MKDLIDKFFENIVPIHSSSWKYKVYNRLKKELSNTKIEEKKVLSLIRIIHNEEYALLFENVRKNKMISSDRTLTYDDKEEIIQILRIKFKDYYNSERSNEENFLSTTIIKNTIIDFKRQKSIPLETIDEQELHKIRTNIDSFNNGNDASKEDVDINYILSSGLLYGRKTNSLINHLLITQSNMFKNHKTIHSFPNLKFEYPSKEFIAKQYNFLKNIDDFIIDVPGYFRHYTFINSRERYFMSKAIEVLKECKNNFENELLPSLVKAGKEESKVRKQVPLLSAIAVDKNGEIIKTAYKGETGCLGNHCEYTLFEEILTSSDRQALVGGDLYVTLEPCNKRTFYVDENNKKIPKMPCAVRCVQAKIKKIFIGTFDPNIRVNWKGIEILGTGTYKFILSNGTIVGSDSIEIEEIRLLIEEFDRKDYRIIKKNKSELIYQIGDPIEVQFFHPDLSIEIMKLNKDFISKHTDKAFPFSKIIK